MNASTQKLILNDWGSAATIGVSVPWVGTTYFADPKVGTFHIPSQAQDLSSLVRSFFIVSFKKTPELKDSWDEMLKERKFYLELMDYASNCEYEKLKSLMSML